MVKAVPVSPLKKMREVPENRTMDPTGDEYLSARYHLSILDEKEPEITLLYFQTTDPFPRYEVGDEINTFHLPLNQELRIATVKRVVHSMKLDHPHVYFFQQVFCEFQLPTQEWMKSPNPD